MENLNFKQCYNRSISFNSNNRLRLALILLLVSVFTVQANNFKSKKGHSFENVQSQISGTVYDNNGSVLPGANIIEKGTTNGVQSDFDGNFTITVSQPNATLVVSYIGFRSKEVAVNGQTYLNITLEEDTAALDEVIVIGYGTQSKRDLTGAVSTLKAEGIVSIPTQSLQDAFQGKIAGVQVTPQNGRPGSQPVVRVRGVGTLNNASPLYVVDGLLLDDISFLPPENVQSLQVLKDASATAIYGSRGANGVIVVTTKNGSSDSSGIYARSYYGVQTVVDKIGMANATEFATLANESATNEGRAPIFADPSQFGEGFNWEDWLIQDGAPIQSHYISASGSSEKSNYFVSANYFNQDGLIRRSDFERVSFRVANEYFISDKVTAGQNLNLTFTDSQEEGEGRGVNSLINLTLQADPTLEPYNPDGTFTNTSINGGTVNPAASVAFNNNENKSFRATGNAYLKFDFLKNFNFKTSLGIDYFRGERKFFIPAHFVTPIQMLQDSRLTVSRGQHNNWLNENLLQYKNSIGEHNFDLLAGITFQEFTSENLSGTRLNLPASQLNPSPDLLYLNAGETEGQTNSNDSFSWGILSYLARANYRYKDRYLFTATFRRDGSSRFSSKNRWGNFPSVAGGWVISNEPFMKTDAISYLKLRGSWGIIGNDKIDTGAAFPTVASNLNAVFGQNQSIYPGAALVELANEELKWEETEQVDVGLEFGFFNNHLSAEVDWYRRETSDILVRVPIPNSVGVPIAPVVNAAAVVNKGFEFNLNWNSDTPEFKYNIGLNLTTVDNEVLSLGGGLEEIFAGGVRNIGSSTRTIVGQEIGAFYGWKQEGIFQDQEEINSSAIRGGEQPGDIKIVDINEDGIINDDDKTTLGSPIPDIYYGLNFSANFKNFDFSLNIDGQAGNKVLYSRTAERGFAIFNYEKFFLDRWTGPGTSNTEPRITEAGHNYAVLDRFLEDGDFVRLRNIQIGYTLPLESSVFNRIRFYVSATNLLTITDYPGYTPQIGGESVIANGIDNGTYPVGSVSTLGVEISF